MPKTAGRPPKYLTADHLFANCYRDGDCYVWPTPPTIPSPILGINSTLAKQFHTNSVARILFSICRFFPAGTRLVRWCSTRHCVNPYHHTEAAFYVEQRAKLPNPNSLLPEQEDRRHLLGPTDEEILAMKPTNTELLRHLADTAARAGFTGKGVPDNRHRNAFKRKEWTPPPNAPVAQDGVPVLIVKGFNDTRPAEPAQKMTDEAWAELESGLGDKRLPEVFDQREDVDHPEPEPDIFAAIRLRNEWERNRK